MTWGFSREWPSASDLRTFRGTVFRLDEHLKRLDKSLRLTDLSPGMSLTRIGEIVVELADRNYPALTQGDDLGLSLFVTPGTLTDRQPTIGLQAYSLPFGQWADYYTTGQSLTETGIRQVPACCWPPELKCRSRMHYYLADRLAHQRYPGSRAVLLDLDGFVSEASTANVLIYRGDEGLISPLREKILPGVSLSVLAELADDSGIPMRYRDVRLDECETAEEILLCSTSPCVWPVTRCNGRPVGRGVPGPVSQRLLSAWSERVGVDIPGQATPFPFAQVTAGQFSMSSASLRGRM